MNLKMIKKTLLALTLALPMAQISAVTEAKKDEVRLKKYSV